MENASKALIMAATVLLGVMILTIGVYLFWTYAEYTSDAYAQMEANQIAQFNSQFLKYYGSRKNEKTNKVEPILCTVHDIISLANLAKQNNIEKEIDDLNEFDVNTFYIQIDVGNNRETRNLEKWNDGTAEGKQKQLDFIEANSIHYVKIKDDEGNYILDEAGNPIEEPQPKYYFCSEEPIISNVTKRVCYMKFIEYIP